MFWNKSKTKKIYIPFDNQDIGGANTFLRNLNAYLDSVNYPYTLNIKEASAIFFPVATNMEYIKHVKKKGGKVIQRLDGVAYPSQHGPEYENMNAVMKDIYLNYADFVVYQAEYSKKQCFHMMGVKPASEYTLITNSVNEAIFFPPEARNMGDVIKFVATGNFRKFIMIEPIVKALDLLESKGYTFELNIIGRTIPELEQLLNRKYIKLHGAQDLNYIANQLRKADIFLHSQLNDNCPNSVLEAIGTGLPVVAFNSGGVNEILHFSLDTLVDVDSKELFHKAEDFSWEKYTEKVEYAINNYNTLAKIYAEHSSDYKLAMMGEKYVKVFDQFLS